MSVPRSCVLQPKTVNFNKVDFICAKNWLLSAYCQIFLSTEQILVEQWWHVYKNEVNVDQNESYLAEVRMLDFETEISMRNSSNTARNINKQGDSFPSNLCEGEYRLCDKSKFKKKNISCSLRPQLHGCVFI